jgi:DNA polymerase III subunit gamma/tau
MSESDHSAFLAKEQVGTIMNAASFSIQEFGAPMNVAFTMAGNKPVKTKSSEFTHRLEQRLRYWAPDGCRQIPWISVHQRTVDAGFVGITIVHVPQAIVARMTAWFDRHQARYREVTEFSVRLPLNGQRPIRRHFDLLAICCQSADPNVWVRHDGESHRLLDIVSPPTRIAETYLPVVGRRFEIAPCIGKLGQKSASRDGMAMISAFDDGEFSYLKTGWEEREHSDRNIERAERKRAVTLLMQKWPVGLNTLFDQKRTAELLSLKQRDPRSRLRSWHPWWLRGRFERELPL